MWPETLEALGTFGGIGEVDTEASRNRCLTRVLPCQFDCHLVRIIVRVITSAFAGLIPMPVKLDQIPHQQPIAGSIIPGEIASRQASHIDKEILRSSYRHPVRNATGSSRIVGFSVTPIRIFERFTSCPSPVAVRFLERILLES